MFLLEVWLGNVFFYHSFSSLMLLQCSLPVHFGMFWYVVVTSVHDLCWRVLILLWKAALQISVYVCIHCIGRCPFLFILEATSHSLLSISVASDVQ
jgi:hypothetical protein